MFNSESELAGYKLQQNFLKGAIERKDDDDVRRALIGIWMQKDWPDERDVIGLGLLGREEILQMATTYLIAHGFEVNYNTKHGVKVINLDSHVYWSGNSLLSVL